jgi:DnaJ-class molecular chaperone
VDPVTLRRTIDTWLKILDQSTYYELLGILEIADEGAIQKAFHEFSQSFHPDNHRGAPEDVRRDVTAIYRRGAEAFGERKPDEAFAQFRKASIAEGKNEELEERFKMLFEISKTLF